MGGGEDDLREGGGSCLVGRSSRLRRRCLEESVRKNCEEREAGEGVKKSVGEREAGDGKTGEGEAGEGEAGEGGRKKKAEFWSPFILESILTFT